MCFFFLCPTLFMGNAFLINSGTYSLIMMKVSVLVYVIQICVYTKVQDAAFKNGDFCNSVRDIGGIRNIYKISKLCILCKNIHTKLLSYNLSNYCSFRQTESQQDPLRLYSCSYRCALWYRRCFLQSLTYICENHHTLFNRFLGYNKARRKKIG